MVNRRYDDRLPFHRRNLPVGAGERLKQARNAAGRSRQDVAAAAGLAMRTLAQIERGHQTPQWESLKRLCDVLDVSDFEIAPRWSTDADYAPTNPVTVPGVGLRALRTKRGLTLKALSEASGISMSTFSRFERGISVSRKLVLRPDNGGRHEERDILLDNEGVAAALGCPNSKALREACLEAAGMADPIVTYGGASEMPID